MHVLIATRDAAAAGVVAACFPDARIETFSRADALQARLAKPGYDICFADVEVLFPDEAEPRQTLQGIWSVAPAAEVIVLCASEMTRRAVDAVRHGAANYLTYPLASEEVRYVVSSLREARRQEEELDYFRSTFGAGGQVEVVGSRTPAMREVFRKAKLVAPTNSTVLLSGETGVGKGVIARLIHSLSNRKDGPFVGVHCGAIPETLVESELFGHEKGAFTGAIRRKPGRFEIAAGGTIFLDEISTIGEPTQVKLLQVLQDKVFQRVGGDADIKVMARIIAATNEDMARLVEQGRFRKDLFFRLNIFPIEIPPLRERPADIPLLAETILHRLNRSQPKSIDAIHPAVLEAFGTYAWPGNVRELENVMERAHILETSRLLSPEAFPRELFEAAGAAMLQPLSVEADMSLAAFRDRAKEEAERVYLKDALTRCRGRINTTAEAAGITPRQLNKLMTRHGLRKEDFRAKPS